MASIIKTLLEEQLDNYRIQRHDFLNNIQVIRGYLQLNKPDKALTYIDEAIGALGVQQEIYRIAQKDLVAILLSWFFALRLKGVEMSIAFPDDMKNEDFWQEKLTEEYASLFHGYTKECVNKLPQEEEPEDLFAVIQLRDIPQGFGCEFEVLLRGESLFKVGFPK